MTPKPPDYETLKRQLEAVSADLELIGRAFMEGQPAGSCYAPAQIAEWVAARRAEEISAIERQGTVGAFSIGMRVRFSAEGLARRYSGRADKVVLGRPRTTTPRDARGVVRGFTRCGSAIHVDWSHSRNQGGDLVDYAPDSLEPYPEQ